MAKANEVLEMLIPNGGYIMVGDVYEGIEFIDCKPITKEEFLAGFEQYDNWKSAQMAEKEKTKQAILDRLGLTADEVAALLA